MEHGKPDPQTSPPKNWTPLFPEDTAWNDTGNLPTFSDDWWIAGADSAEHYQQILLDSAQSNRTSPSVNREISTHTMATTAQAADQMSVDKAAMTFNTEATQPLPIRSRAAPADSSNPSPLVFDNGPTGGDARLSGTYISFTGTVEQSFRPVAGESFDDIQLRLTNEFTPIVEYGWDTLIYIGPPAQEHGQNDDEYNYIKQHFSKPYLMHSATLRDTGSSAFAKLLGPMSARAQRRLKKLGLHLNLPGGREPTYYIDLRPPQDDDAAVEMVTEMSCTPGVLSWHKKATNLGVDRAIVCGTDSLNIIGNRQDLGEQPAYSPLRHHMAVERLLQTISGESPRLNSAPKLWSFVVMAGHLDCARHPRVMSEVYSWLFAGRNSNFIQDNPEVAYRIARSLKAQDLTRVTYALLVGEKAFLQRGFQTPTDSIIFQNQGGMRPLCHLDEDEVNRIDHAAQSFGSRIQSTFMSIANEPMPWMIESTELSKLIGLRAESERDQKILDDAWILLRAYVRDEIYLALTEDLEIAHFVNSTLINEGTTGTRRMLTNFTVATYNRCSVPQRILTRAFWEYLKAYGFRQEPERSTAWLSAHTLDGITELAPDYQNEPSELVPPHVQKEDLADIFDKLNILIADNAVFYMTSEPQRLEKYRLSLSKAQLHDSMQANLRSQAENVDVGSGETFGPRIESVEELTKTMQVLSLKSFSVFPPIQQRASASSNQVRESMKLLSDEPKWQWVPDSVKEYTPPRIHFPSLLAELKTYLAKYIDTEILTPGWASDEIGVENEVPIFDVESLLCLGGDEWKYLPLWAGGLDDGSGGVFVAEHVPDVAVEEGFRGGKRGLSNTIDDLADVEMGEEGYSVIGSSDYEDIATESGISTVGKASRVVTVGTRTTANTVISLEE